MERLSDAARLALVHQALVHRRHGIITSLLEETEHPDARGLFVFNALMVDIKTLMLNPARNRPATDRASLAGSGAAFDRTSALWSAFGEAMERYCAAAHFDDQLHYASEEELGAVAIGLDQFILYGPAQYEQDGFEFARPDPGLRRAWVPGVDLADPTRECLMPAQLVYLGMQVKDKGEIVQQSASTGLACGSDEQRAILSGLAEVIERDAFAAMWQMRHAPRRLVPSAHTMAALLPGVRRALNDSALEICLWDISTDVGLPVVLCLARNRNDGTMSLGASAQLRIGQAIDKAVVEALHGYIWASSILGAGTPLPQRHEIRNPGDHFAHYLLRERQSAFEFLFQNPATVSSDDPVFAQHADVDSLLVRLDQLGHRAIAVDLTTGDIASLGFCVVRVLVPGLQPLLFGDGLVSDDVRRLRKIAAFWGMDGVPAPNSDPHPFP